MTASLIVMFIVFIYKQSHAWVS